MTSRDELLRIAEWHDEQAQSKRICGEFEYARFHTEAAAAIRAMLEQEPVAWLDPNAGDHDDAVVLEAVHKTAREHGAMTWWKRYTVPLCAIPVAAPAQAQSPVDVHCPICRTALAAKWLTQNDVQEPPAQLSLDLDTP